MKTYILYTTSKSQKVQELADIFAADISKTKGRGGVTVEVAYIVPRNPQTIVDDKSARRLSWEWFRQYFNKGDYDGVIFHGSRYYQRKWGIRGDYDPNTGQFKALNGSKNPNNKEYPEFYFFCDMDEMAKGYADLPEFLRMMYHEHGHFDEDLDDLVGNRLTQDSVHTVDYTLKQIQYYHLLIDYRGQAIKEKANAILNAVIRFAKRFI